MSTEPTRYLVTLSVPGGWQDQSRELRAEDLERELQAAFGTETTVRAGRTTQSPGANVARYFELYADPMLAPGAIRDMLVLVIERIGAAISSEQAVHVALASTDGALLAEGTAQPHPR